MQDPAVVPNVKVTEPWTVEKVLESIKEGKPVEDSQSPIPFFHLLERVKTTKREGWRRFQIMRLVCFEFRDFNSTINSEN